MTEQERNRERNGERASSAEANVTQRTSLAKGALHLLKWDRAEAYVRRFST
jgi:hypothetical protein